VSRTIWTLCGGASSFQKLEGQFLRVVESQFRNSTRKLVDSDAEQAVLEQAIDSAKNPVPAGFERLHYLLYTPFRHPPLRNGSRFGTRFERGIFYGAREIACALAEVAYYRLVFLEGTAAPLGELETELTAFRFGIRAQRAVDLTAAPFARFEPRISSKTDYARSQQLGQEMRAAGAQAFLYVSARAEGRGVNLGVFENVFAPRGPSHEQRWRCSASREQVDLRLNQLIEEKRYVFVREQFLVRGALPAPAV
jgi:hypothetical protein